MKLFSALPALIASIVAAQNHKLNARMRAAFLRHKMGVKRHVSKHRNSRAHRGLNCGPGRTVPPGERRSVYRALKAQAKRLGVVYDN